MAELRSSLLFSQIAFHIVLSDQLGEKHAVHLAELLTQHGAEQVSEPSTDGMFDLTGITHIISDTVDFECYNAAEDLMISVIKPSWINSSLVKMKMANPRSHSPDPRHFFSGLMVHIADLPENDKNAIIGGVEAMGGIYASAVSRQVTHIVALSLEPDACRIVTTKKLDIKIVLPHWFDDCLRLQRRISEEPYLLPNAEILEPRDGNSQRPRYDIQLIGISAHPGDIEPTSSQSTASRSVFKDHKFMLSQDLGISDHLRTTIESMIERGAGTVVNTIDQADILVCQYREGQDFETAGTQKKTIGNLSWLYHIISTDSWASPLQRLLHYPISRKGLPGFSSYRISLSNYNGDARLYLENLAKAAGCEFTKSMKQDNTHLITAHTASEKCDAAKEWNIHMINHLWLEDSYAKWAIQSIANPRYTHFPARTNLGEVVGQTQIDREALQTYFFPKIEKTPVKAQSTPIVKKDQKAKTEKPGNTNTVADAPKSSPGLSHRIKDLNSTPTTSKKPRKSTLIDEITTPAPVSVGKENETPSTGGRSAKAKAMTNMSGYAEDFARLAKEKKQKGGILHGGRSSEDRVQVSNQKRAISIDSGTSEEPRASKKPKQAHVEPKMKLLVTGYPEWSQDAAKFKKDVEQLAQIGIEVTEDAIGCSYLVAPKILRTKKFVCAMAGAPTILSPDFIKECLKQNKLVKAQDHPLVDKVGEKKYQVKLVDAVKRAKANSGQLLSGQTIFITQDVRGGPETYQEIIEVNGGKCVIFKGRATSLDHTDEADQNMPDADDFVYLISGTAKSETSLWSKFQEQAEAAGRRPRIVKTDWMLDIALTQHTRWNESYEVKLDGS